MKTNAASKYQSSIFTVTTSIKTLLREVIHSSEMVLIPTTLASNNIRATIIKTHTMGFLSKFYAEDIEHINKGPVDALKSSGASKRQIISFAVIPQIFPSFVGNNLYILDRNIRMATMLGIVGAGGIGYELQSSFRMFEYPKVSAIIIIIFVTIFLIDNLSSYIRSKI